MDKISSEIGSVNVAQETQFLVRVQHWNHNKEIALSEKESICQSEFRTKGFFFLSFLLLN